MKTTIVLSALLLTGSLARSLPWQGYAESRVPSLQIQRPGPDAGNGHPSSVVKNVSPLTVLEYCIADPAPNGNTAWNWGMKPGDTLPFTSGVITAALFTDGSYEGDWLTAARMADVYSGRLVQFERIVKRVDDLMSAPGSDAARRETILQALKDFPNAPEATVLDRFKKDFPSLAQPHEQQLAYMKQGMGTARLTVLDHFEGWPQKASGKSLAQWWDLLKKPQVQNLLVDYVPTPTPGLEPDSALP